jgi:hypothetical protein
MALVFGQSRFREDDRTHTALTDRVVRGIRIIESRLAVVFG